MRRAQKAESGGAAVALTRQQENIELESEIEGSA
jgi:hypothetical protein